MKRTIGSITLVMLLSSPAVAHRGSGPPHGGMPLFQSQSPQGYNGPQALDISSIRGEMLNFFHDRFPDGNITQNPDGSFSLAVDSADGPVFSFMLGPESYEGTTESEFFGSSMMLGLDGELEISTSEGRFCGQPFFYNLENFQHNMNRAFGGQPQMSYGGNGTVVMQLPGMADRVVFRPGPRSELDPETEDLELPETPFSRFRVGYDNGFAQQFHPTFSDREEVMLQLRHRYRLQDVHFEDDGTVRGVLQENGEVQEVILRPSLFLESNSTAFSPGFHQEGNTWWFRYQNGDRQMFRPFIEEEPLQLEE